MQINIKFKKRKKEKNKKIFFMVQKILRLTNRIKRYTILVGIKKYGKHKN